MEHDAIVINGGRNGDDAGAEKCWEEVRDTRRVVQRPACLQASSWQCECAAARWRSSHEARSACWISRAQWSRTLLHLRRDAVPEENQNNE